METVIHTFTTPLSEDRAFQLPRRSHNQAWRGEELSSPFEWGLALDPTSLWFVARIPAVAASSCVRRKGHFVEGLWESDVAELFLRDAHGRYQEFNISADGAWWSMTFSNYRERHSKPRRPVKTAIAVRHDAASWMAVLGIEIQTLDVSLREPLQAHVSGILYGAAEPLYLTSCPQPNFAPDFHDPRCFSAVVLKST